VAFRFSEIRPGSAKGGALGQPSGTKEMQIHFQIFKLS